MGSIRVKIRNYNLPKKPRIFDVMVDEHGNIIRYETQNIKSHVYIEEKEVKRQITEALENI